MRSLSGPRRAAALALLAPALVAVGWTAPAHAAADTCFGKEATVVGGTDPDTTVRGTSGADVIVTSGQRVWAGAGDDLICVDVASDGMSGGSITDIGAGPGDDRVQSETEESVEVYLGHGDDEFTGEARDVSTDSDGGSVFSGEDDYQGGPGPDGDRDTVTVADDQRAVVSVEKAGTFDDVIDLGSLGGSVSLRAAAFANETPIDLGSEPGFFRISAPALPYVVNDATDRMTYQEQALSWDGPTGLLWVEGARGLQYRGSADGDLALLYGIGSISAGGGDDEIQIAGFSGDTGTLAGGTGDDVLMTPPEFFKADLTLNVGARTVTMGAKTKSIAGFERYQMFSDARLTMLGGPGDDAMLAGACQLVMRGGPGNDHLRVGTPQLADSSCAVPARRPVVYGGDHGDVLISLRGGRTTMYGGTGADRVTGGSGDDLVYGDDGNDTIDAGAGRDTVYGGRDTDTCRNAEVRKGCERR